jgi:hypothetical protein
MADIHTDANSTNSPGGNGGRAEGSPNQRPLSDEQTKQIEREVELRIRREMELKMGQDEEKRALQTQLYQVLLAKEIGKAMTPADMPPLSEHVTATRYLAEINTLPAFVNADEPQKIRMVIKAAQKCKTMGPKMLQWKTRAGLSDQLSWPKLKHFLLQLQQEKVDDGVYEDALNNVTMGFDGNGTLEGGRSYIQKIWVLHYLKMECLEQTCSGVVGNKIATGIFRDIHRYALKGLPPILLDKDLYNPTITEEKFIEVINSSIRCQTQIAESATPTKSRKVFFETPNGKTSFKMKGDMTCPSFGGNIRDENPVSEQEITISSKQRTKNWSRMESHGLKAPSILKREREDSDDEGSADENEEIKRRKKTKDKHLRDREAKNKLAEAEDKAMQDREDELDKNREAVATKKRTSIRVAEQAAMAAEKEEIIRTNAELRASVAEMQCFVQAQRRFQGQQMYAPPYQNQQQGPFVHPDRQQQVAPQQVAPQQALQQQAPPQPAPPRPRPPGPRLPKDQKNVTPILASEYKCINPNCLQTGHVILECKADKKGICNACGKLNPGHYARECPFNDLICSNCGKDHAYNDCPHVCGSCFQVLHGIFRCGIRTARVKAEKAARMQHV